VRARVRSITGRVRRVLHSSRAASSIG
jgi:hypothetical protein